MKLIANILIAVGVGLIVLIFFPAAKEEINYAFTKAVGVKYSLDNQNPGTFERVLTPSNTDFSIIIPKIAAVAPIIANVDPSDSKKYLSALRRGVAQAKGTAQPGDEGNVYLFAHSTDTFWNVGAYNAVFFLIGKLQNGDEIDIYYQERLIKYQVYDKKVVEPESSQYFGALLPDEKTLTLQTCYPPGTTFKRLVVLAKQIE